MALIATDPIKMIFAVIFPPLGVFLEVGLKGHFWLNADRLEAFVERKFRKRSPRHNGDLK